jgi:hypothetical protein
LYETFTLPVAERWTMTPREPADTHTVPSGAVATLPAPLTDENRGSDEKARGAGHLVRSLVIGTLLVGVGVGAAVALGVAVGTGVGETRVAGVMAAVVAPQAAISAVASAPSRKRRPVLVRMTSAF